MDALTFGTPRLVRHLFAPTAAQQAHIVEFDLAALLAELRMSRDQFVDLCILCGCDYCPKIAGGWRGGAAVCVYRRGQRLPHGVLVL
jgi:flap endonuclease-1